MKWDLVDLVDGQVELVGDLRGAGLPAALGSQLALRAEDLVQLLDHVDGHADRACLVGERPRDRLPNPPGRVRRELEPLAVIELLRRAHQPDRALLNQIEEWQALVAIPLRDRDDEAKVRLDHLLLGAMVAALDPLGQLDLLSGGEQVDLADVLEEELQRLGRHLARIGLRLLLDRLDDLDVQFLEPAVQLVDLRRLELELVDRDGELVGSQLP